MYEGLKIAQRGRLEDQRGTEINFEMPEFLKRGIVVVSSIALLIYYWTLQEGRLKLLLGPRKIKESIYSFGFEI